MNYFDGRLELISLYIDGMMSEQEMEKFEKQLLDDKELKKEFEEYHKIISEIKNLPEIPIPEGLHGNIMKYIEDNSAVIDLVGENIKNKSKAVEEASFFVDSSFFKNKNRRKKKKKKTYYKEIKFYIPAVATFLIFFISGSIINLAMPEITNDRLLTKSSIDENEVLEEYSSESSDMIRPKGGGSMFMASPTLENDYIANSEIENKEKIIKTYNISLTVENLENFQGTLENLGGKNKSVSLYNNTENSGTQAANYEKSFTASEYENAKNALRGLGTVTNENENSQNVSDLISEKETTLKVLELEKERLLNLLESSKDMSTLIFIQESLSNLELEIENVKGSLSYYETMSEESFINISVYEKYKVTLEHKYTLKDKMKNAFISSINFCTDFFQGSLVAISAIFIPAVLIILVFFFTRKKRKGKKNV